MSSRRSPTNDTDRMISLKVDNLTYRTRKEDLKRSFDRYGDVGDIYIPRDPFSRDSLGYAFVRYYDRRDAVDALEAMDGSLIDGRPIRVQLARYGRFVGSASSRGRRMSSNSSMSSRRPPRRSRSRNHSPSTYSSRYHDSRRRQERSSYDDRRTNGRRQSYDDRRYRSRNDSERERSRSDVHRNRSHDRSSVESHGISDRRSRSYDDDEVRASSYPRNDRSISTDRNEKTPIIRDILPRSEERQLL